MGYFPHLKGAFSTQLGVYGMLHESVLYNDWNFPWSVARVIEFNLKIPTKSAPIKLISGRSTPARVAKWGVGMCEIRYVYSFL